MTYLLTSMTIFCAFSTSYEHTYNDFVWKTHSVSAITCQGMLHTSCIYYENGGHEFIMEATLYIFKAVSYHSLHTQIQPGWVFSCPEIISRVSFHSDFMFRAQNTVLLPFLTFYQFTNHFHLYIFLIGLVKYVPLDWFGGFIAFLIKRQGTNTCSSSFTEASCNLCHRNPIDFDRNNWVLLGCREPSQMQRTVLSGSPLSSANTLQITK